MLYNYKSFSLITLTIILIGLPITGCSTTMTPSPTVTLTVTADSTPTTHASATNPLNLALKAIDTLNSKLGVGMSLMEYSSNLQDTKAVVDQANDPKLNKLIQGYIVALDWWRCDLSTEESPDACRYYKLKSIKEEYPIIKQKTEGLKMEEIDKNAIMRIIWNSEQSDYHHYEMQLEQEDKIAH